MIYVVGDVSGAHFNPAVTLFFAAHRLPGKIVSLYITSQSLDAVAASALLRALFPQRPTFDTTALSGTATQSLALEIGLTALLMFVILNVSTGREMGSHLSPFSPSPILEDFFRPHPAHGNNVTSNSRNAVSSSSARTI
jgi:glycerol uptake facilitator-like aquaporin